MFVMFDLKCEMGRFQMGIIIFQQFFRFYEKCFCNNVCLFVLFCFFFLGGGGVGGFWVSGVSLIRWWNWVCNGDAFDLED